MYARLMFKGLGPVAVIIAGIVMWVIALVVLIAVNASANKLWVCVAGIALGLMGLRYTIRRARREVL